MNNTRVKSSNEVQLQETSKLDYLNKHHKYDEIKLEQHPKESKYLLINILY